jgi:glutamate carboxypeptidase
VNETDSSREKELLSFFASRKDALVGTLKELVERESPSDDAALVTALARHVADRLKSFGVAAETVACEGRGDALVARRGADSGGIMLLGHLDTVWPKGTLKEIPFSVSGGVAKGPGVFDMKAGIAVAMAVLEAGAKGDVKLPAGLTLVLTPDEEVGTHSSRKLLVDEALKRERVLVLEPSGDGGAAKIARKGTGLARVRFHGVASHAGLDPEKGASALLELSRYVLFADALADREVGSSVVPTVASAGSRTNVVPESAEVIVDYRVWTAAEGERITNALGAYRPNDPRVTIEFEGGVNRPPMEPQAASLDMYARAAAVARNLDFDLPNARVGGASDGNLTAAAGVPTLDGLGPSGGGAHARSEHLLVEDLPRRAALLAGLLEGLGA